MTEIPHLMQALIAESLGEPLRLEQVSTPRPGAGEVLIRVLPVRLIRWMPKS